MTDQPAKPGWRMGGITVPEVEDYLYAMLPPRDEVLAEMEADASKNDVSIVGPAVARVLYQLATISGAKKIFEMGSAIGYSTIWWARAVGEGGRVVYTDGDPKRAEKARRYFDRAGVSQRITVRVGDALEILSEQKEPYDIIFNDIDKTDYPRVVRAALPRLKSGGLLIADNVLWSGKLHKPNPDAQTKAILEFNKLIYESKELFTTILPIRDGVSVCVKK
ncbi:MAG: O-methyltransferase [Terriglobales bacterium]|jgi:predicted O-methyltransferase YrrM